MSHPAIAYKVLASAEMAALVEGTFVGAPVDMADGYIHLSTEDQLAETISKYFADQSGIWVVSIDLKTLGATVKWELSRGGALFPHIYGQLSLDAVIAAAPLSFDAFGAPSLPRIN